MSTEPEKAKNKNGINGNNDKYEIYYKLYKIFDFTLNEIYRLLSY